MTLTDVIEGLVFENTYRGSNFIHNNTLNSRHPGGCAQIRSATSTNLHFATPIVAPECGEQSRVLEALVQPPQ